MRRSLAVVLVMYGAATFIAGQEPLVLVRTIDLPHVEGRIDHLALDGERLFVAALGNNSLEVLDLKAGARMQSVRGLHEPQGVAVVQPSQQVVVANGQGGAVQFRNGSDFHVATTAALGDDADDVRYERAAQRVYVGYGNGGLAILNATDGRLLGEVALAGHPEAFELEGSGPRLFVNVPDAKQIAVVDRTTMKVTSTWPIVGAESNFPMALDDSDQRLFVGCRRPARVLIYNTSSGKAVGSAAIVGDADDLFYDSVRKRLYVSGGEGFVDVFQQQGPDHLRRLAHIPTAAGARTSLFVPEQGRFYLAVPHRGNQTAEIRVYQARR